MKGIAGERSTDVNPCDGREERGRKRERESSSLHGDSIDFGCFWLSVGLRSPRRESQEVSNEKRK